MSKQKFHVVVARPVVLSAVVEVEANSDEEAMRLASEQAANLPNAMWRTVSDEQDYAIDPVAAIPDDEFGDDDIVASTMEYEQYFLLRGNTCIGEGYVVSQPWFDSRGEIMQSDILGDWISELKERATRTVGFDDVIERGIHKASGGVDH